ncbi:MAG: methyltransferase FkbM family [Fibrobacteres bacterium]|nr:methyltransferase FkbM family [Fibrobacterota bacterium]
MESANPRLYNLDLRSQRAVSENFLNDFSMRAHDAGNLLYCQGRTLNALMAFKYGLTHDPSELRLHLMTIVTHITLGRNADANRHIEILRRLFPKGDFDGTLQSTLNKWEYIANSAGNQPITLRNDPACFTCSLLGIDGEFGNQIFQYAFMRIYSDKYGLRFETYDWIGKRLFGLKEARISRILPFILEIEYCTEDPFALPPLELGVCDRDTQGYFQGNTRFLAPYKDGFRSMFKPIAAVESIMQEFMARVRVGGKTLVAIHLRRGSARTQGRMSGTGIYLEWLRALWPTLDAPVLFLASDDLAGVRADLAEFNPITAEDVRMPFQKADFYPDFFVLTQADYLAAGNSTYSFAASMLNSRARMFVRPDAAQTVLVPYDPWNDTPTL